MSEAVVGLPPRLAQRLEGRSQRLRCPGCGNVAATAVLATVSLGADRRRRRCCLACGQRFRTRETVERIEGRDGAVTRCHQGPTPP
jgi:hypothetical protein